MEQGNKNEPDGNENGSASAERTRLERVLGLFGDVRAGEGPTAVLLALALFLLLLAYYLLKTAREPLILASGAEVKSYTSAGQALILIPGTYLYGRIAERVGRMRLITIVTLFFVSNLVLFFIAGKAEVPHIGVAFFLWVGVFNMMIVAQFWSFGADIYRAEQGKRLFAILGIGGAVGAVAGAALAGALFKTIGAFGLMLTAAGFLLAALSVTAVVHRRETRAGSKEGAAQKEEPLSKEGSFQLLLKDRYLLLIGALSFVLNWVNASGEYILDRTLLDAAQARMPAAADAALWTRQFIGEFKANYFFWVNTLTIFMQLFVVSRAIKYLGVRTVLFVVPAISLTGYSMLVLYPVLTAVLVVKIVENSMDYSLQNTARQALWLVTSRDAKYKVKSIVDTFLVRAGDLMSAAVTAIGVLLHFRTAHFVLVNIGLVLVWMLVLVFLTRRYLPLSRAAEQDPRDPDPVAA